MITVTRALVRQVRTALRKAGIYQQRSTSNPPVAFIAGPDGLYVRAKSQLAAVEYHLAQSMPADTVWVPAEFLDDCEGSKAEPVSLETLPDGHVKAEFRDKNIPQLIKYDAVTDKDNREFPTLPSALSRNEPDLLPALVAAAETTDPDSSRYALGNIQFKGSAGKLVATDGRHLLVQGGFSFPWKGDVLVKASPFFTFAELAKAEAVEVGQSDTGAVFRFEAWTGWFQIDREGRFPKTDDLIRSTGAAMSSCHLSASDAEFLLNSIDSLPSDATLNYPATLELNGQVAVRSKAPDQAEPTELVLTSSRPAGEPFRCAVNRHYLARSVRLGFRDFHFFGEAVPALCQDERRAYVWGPLSNDCIAKPSPNAIRIESPAEATVAPASRPATPQKETPVSTTKPDTAPLAEQTEAAPSTTKRHRVRAEAQATNNLSPMEQAKAIRATLRQALVQNNELIRGLKRQDRQARLVANTLDSLKQLKVA